jgi:hypothetical protein
VAGHCGEEKILLCQELNPGCPGREGKLVKNEESKVMGSKEGK